MIVRCFLLCLCLLFAPYLAAAEWPEALEDFDALVEETMKEWRVPGLSIAIVKDGETLLAKGYGTKQYGKDDPVDADTLFAIASNTKAFTCAALGMLVDEGKIAWDDRVIEHLPEFQLYDPYMTREITIRDLVSHRSGLERKDFVWYRSNIPRQEIMQRLRYHEPDHSFRSQFGYNNNLYVVASILLERVTGNTWDEFIQQRIFDPLGMAASNTSIRGITPASNAASPFMLTLDDEIVPVEWFNLDTLSSAGAFNSSANDMAKWMKCLLAEGKVGDAEIISATQIREMRKPQTIMGVSTWGFDKRFPDSHFKLYGLGHTLNDHKGHFVVRHGGVISGFRSTVVFIPGLNLGITVVINLTELDYALALADHVMDAFIDGETSDRFVRYREIRDESIEERKNSQKEFEESRVANAPHSHLLEAYKGTFSSGLYGDVEITMDGESLRLTAPGSDRLTGLLSHWHYDTFLLHYEMEEYRDVIVTATFNADRNGEIDSLCIEIVDRAITKEYMRKP